MRTTVRRFPIIFSLLFAVLFLVVMILGAVPLYFLPGIADSGEWVMTAYAESVIALADIGLVALMGMNGIWTERKHDIWYEILTSMYFVVVILFTTIYSFATSVGSELQPIYTIISYISGCLLIGFAEEVMFRGVVANIIFDKYGKDALGVWFSALVSGLIFGALHLTNVIGGSVAFSGVLTQAVIATLMGAAWCAIYYRTRNIWVTILLHAFNDMAALIGSGLFVETSFNETVSSYGIENMGALVVYLIVLVVLLRPKKIREILGRQDIRSSSGSRARFIAIVAVLIVLACIAIVFLLLPA